MITVGPPDGPHVKIPGAYTITEQPDGVYVSMARINQIASPGSSNAARSPMFAADRDDRATVDR